jgi:biotin-dependent carboxylase-like uncharacterized protein
MLEVLKAPPFATVQDLGRYGHRHEGVPPAGAMDPSALRWLNRHLGNPEGAAAIEWALGPGTFRLQAPTTIALGPGGGSVNGMPAPPWTALPCPAGAEVAVAPPGATRFGYLAVAGGVDVPVVLGSRSTYLPGVFGGVEGRRLRSGDRIPCGTSTGTVPLASGPPPRESGEIRILRGPQAHLFDDGTWAILLGGAYAIAPASDRMGYRLDGPVLRHGGPASLPSEPACPGAIQVPDGGAPIVLMPDGPTVGGYPKIAVVVSGDLGRLAQLRPGDRPILRLVSLEQAIRERPAP